MCVLNDKMCKSNRNVWHKEINKLKLYIYLG